MSDSTRSFLSNLAFLLILNVIVKPFWIFGIDRTVQNTVAAGEYGIYFGIFNFTYLFHILLDFGINNYNNRKIASEPSLVGTTMPQLSGLKLILCFLYVGTCFLGAGLLAYKGFEMRLLSFLLLNQILLSFILFFRSNISGLHYFKTDSALSITDKLLMILFCAALLWGNLVPEFEIMHFIYGQTAAYAITFFIALFTLFKIAAPFRWSWSMSEMRSLLRESLPYALVGLLMSIYFRIDGVMLKEMIPDEGLQADIYASAYRILDAVSMFGFLFASLLMPMLARMMAQKESVASLTSLGARLLLFISVAIAIPCLFFAPQIMDLLYLRTSVEQTTVFALLITSFVFSSSVYIFGSVLLAGDKMKILNLIAGGSVLLNVVLNVFLIKKYGAVGAAIATLCTQILASSANYFWASKKFDLPFSIKTTTQVLAYILLLSGSTYLLLESEINWILAFILSGLMAIPIGFLCALLRIQDLKTIDLSR